MRMLSICLALVALCAVSVKADTIDLGTAAAFGALGEAGVTNTGPSVIYGSVAGSIGTPAVTGFTFSTSPGPGTVVAPGVGYITGVPATVFDDATTAYDVAAGLASTTLTGDLGGKTLTPGVYSYGSSAQLTGPLTLNFQGLSNQDFVFKIGSTLTTASASSVLITNPGTDDSVFWQVGSSATLGTTTSFYGNIIADASISLDNGATITCGSALALTGAVTLDTNTVSTDTCAAPANGGGTGGGTTVPEPGTLSLLALGFSGIAFLRSKRRR